MKTESITTLAKRIAPIAPSTLISKVAEYFLSDTYSEILSLPVVVDDILVGVISRYDFMEVYLSRYGRDLYERRPVSFIMGKSPIRVAHDLSYEEASDMVTKQITFPIKEDFIITENRKYYGIGVVLDLLKAMEDKLRNRQQELDSAYQKLKQSQAQLVQTSKMAALGTMVAGVAHEINTPLGYVRNNLEILQASMGQVDELYAGSQELVKNVLYKAANTEQINNRAGNLANMLDELEEDEVIEESHQLYKDSLYGIDRISEIVMGLKNFSRLDRAMDEQIDIHQCINSTLTIAKNVVKDKVKVEKNFAAELSLVECMPSRINQVLLNIITNAAQAIENTGKITITTLQRGQFVLIKIKDNGSGIPLQVRDKIFDPFFTTKKVGDGTGLGMPICHQIIEQHNGEISFETEIGSGTEFSIKLPIKQPKTAQVQVLQ